MRLCVTRQLPTGWLLYTRWCAYVNIMSRFVSPSPSPAASASLLLQNLKQAKRPLVWLQKTGSRPNPKAQVVRYLKFELVIQRWSFKFISCDNDQGQQWYPIAVMSYWHRWSKHAGGAKSSMFTRLFLEFGPGWVFYLINSYNSCPQFSSLPIASVT